MKIIARPRGQGKTSELIKMAAASEGVAYIVVSHYSRAYQVQMLAKKMGVHVRFPITYDEIKRKLVGQTVDELYLDDIDDAIREIIYGEGFRGKIMAAALTHQPEMGYICAACGAPAECNLVDLDTGTTLTEIQPAASRRASALADRRASPVALAGDNTDLHVCR